MISLNIPAGVKHSIQKLGLGVFDGVHLGHQFIVNQCDAVMTFDPHPDIVLGKKQNLQHLTTSSELQFYIPKLVRCHFSLEVSRLSPLSFLNELILLSIFDE